MISAASPDAMASVCMEHSRLPDSRCSEPAARGGRGRDAERDARGAKEGVGVLAEARGREDREVVGATVRRTRGVLERRRAGGKGAEKRRAGGARSGLGEAAGGKEAARMR
jgi:hypothetical protein